MSLKEGDFVGAGLSLLSMVPYVGDAVGKTAKAARAAKRLAKLGKRIAALTQKIKSLKRGEKGSCGHSKAGEKDSSQGEESQEA